jgi:NADH-quinone oxidoreductase subunit G
VRVSANGSSISGKIKCDNNVSEGTVVLPLGFEELPVHELDANLTNGLKIELSKD